MKLRWLPETWDDIERLFWFLADKNPAAARRATNLITSGAERLLETPEIGAPMGDDSFRRELYLPFGAGAYVLRYRLDGDCVVIIRVWHSREHRETPKRDTEEEQIIKWVETAASQIEGWEWT